MVSEEAILLQKILDAYSGAPTPAQVWAYATRTLTDPAADSDLAHMLVGISPTAAGRAALLDNLDVLLSTRASAANLALLMADVGDASAATLGSIYGILGNPATSLAATLATIEAYVDDVEALLIARLDVAVSTRSSHSAADVWAVAARTLTNPALASDLANMQVAISPSAAGEGGIPR